MRDFDRLHFQPRHPCGNWGYKDIGYCRWDDLFIDNHETLTKGMQMCNDWMGEHFLYQRIVAIRDTVSGLVND